jgi:gliding motility-associated-like protein
MFGHNCLRPYCLFRPTMKHIYALLFFSLAPLFMLVAQPANDDCPDAFVLPDQLSYCSGEAAFSTLNATASFADPNDYAICIDEPDAMREVWFSFVAQRTAVNIQVRGAVAGSSATLRAPQFVLYEGSCGALNDVGCRSPFQDPQTGQFENGGNILFNELIIGDTYFIMVGARQGNTGSFEICLEQFDAVPSPSSDCQTGVVLCDKSPFAVDFLRGTGLVEDDLLSDNIDCGGQITEFNSAWYRWTCDQPGTLSFVLTPLGSAFNEDLDFVVYEMDNIDDCGGRRVLRQMFSGETRGQGALNLPCLGDTGLSDADPDNLENCGCDPGDNNFLRSIDMVSGRSYALVIKNFSGSGDGFSIEFGGTGTFLGPTPAFSFSSNEVCVGDALTFTDNSFSLDGIASQEWDFGPSASPRTASGPGPHSVVFSQPGTPEVELIITTTRECREVLSQQEVTVTCCDGQFTGSGVTSPVVCPNEMTGTIDFSGSSSFSPGTLTYNWSNGETTEDLTALERGDYTVTVSDESTCSEVFTFTVDGPEPFVFDTLISMPDCAGGDNGALEFTILSGGAGGYEYSFDGSAFSTNNIISGLVVRTVNVRARDANGCLVDQDIFVNELELGLVEGATTFIEPVCAGDANGQLIIELANGQPNYTYDFNLGDGPQPINTRGGLPAGTYRVDAEDAEGCRGIFNITIPDPPNLTVAVDGNGSTCFGTDDGNLVVLTGGGRPGYSYRWADGSVADTLRSNLVPGTYTISVTDQNGCLRSDAITLTEPNEIFPVLEETNDLLCFEEPTGSFLLSATGGTPGYTYSSDGENFQVDPLLGGLLSGNYTLYVMDANGCLDSLNGTLDQPLEFIVDPGPDVRITLGFDTLLRAVSNYNPVTYVWNPGNPEDCINLDCGTVRVAPVNTTLYTVIGTNAAGCLDSAQVEVAVIADRPIYIPNVFSPNGDGSNDLFTLFGGPAVESVEYLRIYHRWGGLVFENEDFLPNEPSLGWDGTGPDGRPLNPAVFVYSASVRFINGTTVEFAGDVTLMR